MQKLREIKWIDNGTFDMQVIIDNFDILKNALNDIEHLQMKTDTLEQVYPNSAQIAIESTEPHLILGKNIRAEMKISQVHVVAGGAGDTDTEIDIYMNPGESLLNKPIIIKSTEKMGKLKLFDVSDITTISQLDEIYIVSNTNRKILVGINFEGVK